MARDFKLPAELSTGSRGTGVVKYPAGKKTAVFWVDEIKHTHDGQPNPTLGWYKCKTPYNEAFIAAMKISIPVKNRKWVPAEKVWAVAPASSEEIVNLAAAYFDKIVELNDDPIAKATGRRRGDTEVRSIKDKLAQKSKQVQNVMDEFGPRKVEV